MSRLLFALVGLCALSVAFAQGRPAYICEVLFNNFCPTNAATCANDPVLHFSGTPYGFSHFNLVSFGNMYAPSGDVEGRTAVRNNVDLTSYSIGYQLSTAGVSANESPLPYTMVVGGDAKWHGGSVHPDGSGFPFAGPKEYIFVGGDFSNADSYLQNDRHGQCSTPGCLNNDFDAAQAYYKDLSAAFATLPNNANFNIQPWGTIELTCGSMADAQYVISMTPNQFSSINFWSVTGCNPNSGLIVNIAGAGSQVKFAGATQSFFKNAKTLYNVVPSSATPSIRVEVGVNGNLLAPSSNYNQPGMGVFIGQVIVANVQQVHQINFVYCQPPAPTPTPTPSTNLCPAFETTCAGLDLSLSGNTYSFRDFNVISFQDFKANTGDVEGRLAVQRDATFGYGYSVGYELQTATNQPDRSLPFSLVVGRDLTWGSGALYPQGNGIPYPGTQEDMYVGGTFTSSQADLVTRRSGGPCATPGCYDAAFNAAKSCYTGYSNTIANQADNVAKTIEWSGLSITCNDASASDYYVSLTPAEMSQFTYTTVGNCNFQARWYINIRGTGDVEITGASFPAIPGGVVYNIIGSGRTVNVHDTQVSGHVLAPSSTLNQVNGVIVGKVVAGNVVASLQINKQNTCPQPTTVVIPVVVVVPSANNIVQFSNDALRVGDSVKNAVVTSVDDGNKYSFSHSISVGEGEVIYVKASSVDSRVPTEKTSSNSASMVSITIAAIIALIVLAF